MSVFDYEKVEVAESSVEVASVDDASSVGTIEGASPACAGRMMTVQVLVSVTPFRSVAFGEAAGVLPRWAFCYSRPRGILASG